MRAFFLPVVFCLAASAVHAERLVTNPEMCKSDASDVGQEEGLTLEPTGYWEIEYHCDFDRPIDLHWDSFHTQSRAGYCESPGPDIEPTVFVIQMGDYEPGLVRIWQMGTAEPIEFQACP
ncbi:MAG: hypothetical protein QNJ16_02915 [Rhodobacter sp.]|nr:hypothetical protein [Rhodobacter sp.]